MQQSAMKIGVFCSASPNLEPQFYELARTLGAQMAERGYGLVYGAGSIGMMGELARAMHAGGGYVFGVIPHALDRFEVTYTACDRLIYTETMRERKAIMDENAAAFIALPGGIGTMEEVLEIITLKQLGYHSKPVIILNGYGYFDPLLAQLTSCVTKQFAQPELLEIYTVCTGVEEALRAVERELAPQYQAVEESPEEKAIQELEGYD